MGTMCPAFTSVTSVNILTVFANPATSLFTFHTTLSAL